MIINFNIKRFWYNRIMKYFSKLKLQLAFSCGLVLPVQANIFLQKPKVVTPPQVSGMALMWGTSFNWRIANRCDFTCCYNGGESSFFIKFFNWQVWSYGIKSASEKGQPIKITGPRARGYYFAKPLQFDAPEPVKLTLSELINLLDGKKFIFYTGAGISMAGGVYGMNDLERSLGMGNGRLSFLKTAFLYPKAVARAFDCFCKQAIYSEPTSAHQALHQIAQSKEVCILTENVDLLQHRTGSLPIHSQAKDLDIDAVNDDDWRAVDLIICVGLSHDDCGLLAYYKSLNPSGVLVSIDVGTPNYLSETDYLLQGDAQLILPELATRLG